ncbi:hypothetical protein EDD16DRAFT_1598539 [Pisolithus croceorrhizus]|nr:hypothetical protein EDD16DRAFT_1598539 [Pisolithus croceorrhizus]KAI6146599.1 hypothetical protein EDD17DRAFT_94752 [Pisolithus thermaeus]
MRRNDPNSTTQCAAVCRFATLTSSALLGYIIRSYMLYLVAQATAQRSALMAGSSPAMNCVPQPGSARRQHSLPAVLSGRRVLLRNGTGSTYASRTGTVECYYVQDSRIVVSYALARNNTSGAPVVRRYTDLQRVSREYTPHCIPGRKLGGRKL